MSDSHRRHTLSTIVTLVSLAVGCERSALSTTLQASDSARVEPQQPKLTWEERSSQLAQIARQEARDEAWTSAEAKRLGDAVAGSEFPPISSVQCYRTLCVIRLSTSDTSSIVPIANERELFTHRNFYVDGRSEPGHVIIYMSKTGHALPDEANVAKKFHVLDR